MSEAWATGPADGGFGPPGPRAALVTGGAGFLGHHLVRRLLAEGRRVIVLDDLSSGSLGNLRDHPALSVRVGSVLDRAAVEAAARPDGRPVDAVFHLAGVVGVRLADRERERAWAVATEGTRIVLGATESVPAVLFSSSAVYGIGRAQAAREDAPPSAADALAYDGGVRGYAAGKLALEDLGRAAAQAGRPVLVVRPFNVVGEGQTGRHGMVLPRFLAAARAGRPLVVYDDGGQSRAFSDVHVFLDALARLLRAPAAWGSPLNVGAPTATPILELAHAVRRAVAERHGIEAPIRFVPYARVFPGRRDVRARSPDPARLVSLVGEIAWPPVAAIVERLVAALDAGEAAAARPAG